MSGEDRPWWASEAGTAPRTEPGPWGPADRRAQAAPGAPGDPRGPVDEWAEPGDVPPQDRWTGDEPVRDHDGPEATSGEDWIGEVTDTLGRVTREALRRAPGLAADAQAFAAAAAGTRREESVSAATSRHVDTCGICPICSLLRVVAEARPELVEHLTEASRHLTLALKVLVDAQVDRHAVDPGFHRIDLDD